MADPGAPVVGNDYARCQALQGTVVVVVGGLPELGTCLLTQMFPTSWEQTWKEETHLLPLSAAELTSSLSCSPHPPAGAGQGLPLLHGCLSSDTLT